MSVRLPSPDVLAGAAAESSSLVDMMRRLALPMTSRQRRYLGDRLVHYRIPTAHFEDETLPPRPRREYPRAALAEAARECTSVAEVLAFLGVPSGEMPYSHVRKQLARFGIDTSHFVPDRRRSRAAVADAALVAAVEQSRSMAGALKALGLPIDTTAKRRVSAQIGSLGLDTSHFTGQAHAKGRPARNRKSATEILRTLPAGSQRAKTTLLRRALDERGVPRVCDECGVGDQWQGRCLTLEIDHRNGNRLDNRQRNLRYLCPSCHSQTRTYSRRAGLRQSVPSRGTR